MNENLNDELSRRPLSTEVLKMDKIFCQGCDRAGRMEKSWFRCQKVPVSKLDSTEDSPSCTINQMFGVKGPLARVARKLAE
ncbi:hypothetical protein AVEN_52972-1 [Araneus ventricosus]|uniref:Uncharacterized protein n=1 Tax=Araneus ventricosus TaxID=182803 RepID=A0A4Y2SSP8_ARAVE|nr:hypothetical protein AVEN_52972-1 [Araneus ventricosus]